MTITRIVPRARAPHSACRTSRRLAHFVSGGSHDRNTRPMIGASGTSTSRARRPVSSTVRRVAATDSHSVRRRTGSSASGKTISARDHERHEEEQRRDRIEVELDVRRVEPDRLALVERVVEAIRPEPRTPQHVDDAVGGDGVRRQDQHADQPAQHAGRRRARHQHGVDERPDNVDVEHLERARRTGGVAAQDEERAEGRIGHRRQQDAPVEAEPAGRQHRRQDPRQDEREQRSLDRLVRGRHEQHQEEQDVARPPHDGGKALVDGRRPIGNGDRGVHAGLPAGARRAGRRQAAGRLTGQRVRTYRASRTAQAARAPPSPASQALVTVRRGSACDGRTAVSTT